MNESRNQRSWCQRMENGVCVNLHLRSIVNKVINLPFFHRNYEYTSK